MSVADLIFAVIPILLLIGGMTNRTPMPSSSALPLAAVVIYGIRLIRFETDTRVVHAAGASPFAELAGDLAQHRIHLSHAGGKHCTDVEALLSE